MENPESVVLDIKPGDALLIVPPFAGTRMPHLGVHVLQACARREGFEVRVLYANLLFASLMGETKYDSLCRSPVQSMFGERLFAAAAYELPHLGKDDFDTFHPDETKGLDLPDLIHWSKYAVSWVNRMGEAISQLDFPVVGCTTTFEQTAAAIALLSRIKCLTPETITIVGGANCEGEMAEGMISLSNEIDYVFSGESESSFPDFLRACRDHALPSHHIISGEPCTDLDQIPLVDFSEFFAQYRLWMEDSPEERDDLWLCYETSRGCWWGEKRRCTFCGLNGNNIGYREKSAEKALADLRVLTACYGTNRVCMADKNMPVSYYETLLPRLPQAIPGLSLLYELKDDFSLEAAEALSKAGVSMMQPEIESLSTACLKLMGKGSTAAQNLNLLRHARSAGMEVNWTILFALPGDTIAEYEKMLEMIPLLRHLQPPAGVSRVSLERFSTYLVKPEEYRITDLRPLPVYDGIFPSCAAVGKLAYHFSASYPSESREARKFMESFEQAIEGWRESWDRDEEPPALELSDLGSGRYLLRDTRGIPESREMTFITEDKATVAVTGRSESEELVEWAKERKLLLEVDGKWIPLITGDPALLRYLASPTSCAPPDR